MKTKRTAIFFAVLAAALYAVNVPLSRQLLVHAQPGMMAAFLYLGAGLGLLLCRVIGRISGRPVTQEPLTRRELPCTIAMVVLDIAAPILLMLGIARTSPANVSLLNNFEIVATSLIALLIFHEVLSRRLWLSILLVTLASVLLSFEGSDSFRFQSGSLFVLGACVCWGFENNCTRMLSSKSSVEIVIIKGCFSGLGSLCVALLSGERFPDAKWLLCILLLGFIAYGLSINFYILAQKELGAAKTSVYYSIAPFLGAALSMLLGERPGAAFYAALAILLLAAVLMAKDTIALQHTHVHTHSHSHAHCHGSLSHTHMHEHAHTHIHVHAEDETAHLHQHGELSGHDHIHTV